MAQGQLDQSEIEELLRRERIVRVAFSANDRLYLLPLGYVWFDGALHLMTMSGQKTAMASSNPHVAFQIDDSPAAGLLGWSSITGEGTWEIITDQTLQTTIGKALLGRFPELREWAEAESAGKASANELLFARIRPLRMTGRRFVYDPMQR